MQEMQETWVRSLDWEDPLELQVATCSSILAWQIPWTEEPGRLWAMGSQRVGHDLAARHTCTYSGSSLPSQGWKPHSLHRKVESAAELPGKSQWCLVYNDTWSWPPGYKGSPWSDFSQVPLSPLFQLCPTFPCPAQSLPGVFPALIIKSLIRPPTFDVYVHDLVLTQILWGQFSRDSPQALGVSVIFHPLTPFTLLPDYKPPAVFVVFRIELDFSPPLQCPYHYSFGQGVPYRFNKCRWFSFE